MISPAATSSASSIAVHILLLALGCVGVLSPFLLAVPAYAQIRLAKYLDASVESTVSTTEDGAKEDDSIRSFHFNVPEEQLVDLRRRLAATRWPDRETVTDAIAGRAAGDDAGAGAVLGKRTTTGEKCEARLNALPQFVTTIDGRRHSLHPRPLETCERSADHHHARVARIDHRAAEDHRPAHRPDCLWRKGGRRI